MAKRTAGRTSKQAGQQTAALQQNGLKAFRSGRYDQAIVAWEKAGPSAIPVAALAEAYFRRGLAAGSESDLKRAAALQPGELRYTYHLGLLAQRAGCLDEALAAYEQVRQGGGDLARRAAYPLAVALLEKGNSGKPGLVTQT